MAEIAAASLPLSSSAFTEHRVLVVEDSRVTRDMVSAFLVNLGGIGVDAVASMHEARQALARRPAGYLCAVLDLTLPDAPNGEVVDAVRAYGTPIIVLSGSYSESARQTLVEGGVVDYVVKRLPSDLLYVADLVRRIRDNPAFEVLVVDDSPAFRDYSTALLRRLSYRTLSAANGFEALETWAAHPDLALVITDVSMPVMDGYELIAAIRQRATREELPIIGVSDRSRADMSTRLLKAGANDFLNKPFEVEEFNCRVAQNIDLMGYIRRLKEMSRRDFLTDLWNRRHLFEAGEALFRRASRDRSHFAVALIDVDHFKRINDSHGHPVGDQALKCIAACIAASMRPTDVVARYGGEEFACVLIGASPSDTLMVVDRLRARIAALDFRVEDLRVPLTVSCGVAQWLGTSFEAMLESADVALYAAKQGGRNRTRVAETERYMNAAS